VVKADGVRWMREFLGQDADEPIRHPQIAGNIGSRIMGVTLRNQPGDACATLIPSVGCPMGCNFCSTSAMFGGKGRSVEFYGTGEEIFEIMCQLEKNLKIKAFFVMDENFLVNTKRSLRLLELMEEHGKAWSLYVFSSANVLRKYTMDQIVRLGISWVWMGLEGKDSQYKKLAGTNTLEFVKQLQDHGVRVLGSTIIGLEEHTSTTSMWPSTMLFVMRQTFINSCCTPRFPELPCSTNLGRKEDFSRSRNTPSRMSTVSCSSTTAILTFLRDRKRSFYCGRSIAISISTARVSCGSFGRRCAGGSDSRIIPTSGFVIALRMKPPI